MKVRESLVYDKHSAQVVGFVHLRDIDNQLNKFEKHSCPIIATNMLCVIVPVWGVFTNLRFPYAHFPTAEVTGAFGKQ